MQKLTHAFLVTLATAACAQGAEIGVGGLGGAVGNGNGNGNGSNSGSGSGTQTNTQSGTPTATTPAAQVSSTSEASDASSATTGAPCSEMPCKLVEPQCGCEDTRQCSIDGTGERACVPKGTVAIGQGCGDMDECVPGAMCLVIPTVGHCFEFCESDAQCTAPGGRCMITLNDGAGGTVPGVTLCSENCDPVTSSGCPATGTGCQPGMDANDVGFTVCTDAGTGGDVAPCPNGYECAPGFGCINVNMVPRCLAWCNMASPNCGGLDCIPLNPPIIVGGTNYGVCN